MMQAPLLPEEDQRPWTPPILLPVVAFAGGIGVVGHWEGALWLAAVSLGLAIPGFFLLRKRRPWGPACLLLLAGAAGMLHQYRANHLFAPNHIRNFVSRDPSFVSPRVQLSGRVVSPSVIHQPEKTFPYHSRPDLRTRFLIEARELTWGRESLSVSGLVEICVPEMVDRYHCGQEVRLHGRLSTTETPISKSPFALHHDYYKNSRIFVRVRVSGSRDIAIQAWHQTTCEAVLEWIRQAARGFLLQGELPPEAHTSGLLTAFIFGDRYQLENDLNQAMINIGAVHLLAVSGFNLAVLAVGLWFLCRVAGVSRQITTVIVVLATLVYTTLTDFQPSVVRATIMIVILNVGVLLNKQSYALNSLAVAGFLILLINPNQLFDPGFQLSFLSTLGLVVLSSPIYLALTARPMPVVTNQADPKFTSSWRLMVLFARDQVMLMFCASLAAGLASLPVVMYHFQRFSLMGAVSTVILYIPATLLTLAGFAKLVLVILIPGTGPVLGWVTNALSVSLSYPAMLLSRLPGASFDVPAPPGYLILLYFVVLFYPLFRRRADADRWRRPGFVLLVAAYLTLWVTNSLVRHPWLYLSGSAEGQSILVHAGNRLVLVDSGTSTAGGLAELVRQACCRSLSEPGAVLLTCPDQRFFNDIGSVAGRCDRLPVLLTPGFSPAIAGTYEPVHALLSDGRLARTTAAAGTRLEVGGVTLQVLSPPADIPDPLQAKANPSRSTILPQESGAVVLVDLGSAKVLVGSVVNTLACTLIGRDQDALTAGTLILNSATAPGPGLAHLISRMHLRHLVVVGSLHPDRMLWYRSLAREKGFEFLAITGRNGFFIDDAGRCRY
jgi:competence protein ComEC